MAISFPEFRQFCQGKVGTIYIARNGGVTVVLIEGKTYLYSNYGGGVIENPAPEYWVNSIDRAGGYSDYWLLGMIAAADMPYKADPINPITPEQFKQLTNLRREA